MVSCLQIPSHLLKMTHRVHCEIPFDFYFTFPLLSFKKNKTSSPWSLPMDTDLCNLYTKRQHLGEGGNVGKLAKLVPWQIGIWEAGLLPPPRRPGPGLLLWLPSLPPCCSGWFAPAPADQHQCREKLTPCQLRGVPPGHHLEIRGRLHGHLCSLHCFSTAQHWYRALLVIVRIFIFMAWVGKQLVFGK